MKGLKILLLFTVFLALIWMPVIFNLYSWKEGMILTISLSIASWLIDKFILDKRRRKSQSNA